jgi:hypothetical protein
MEKLVIFDYSGTLSLEAPQFGRPESLLHALAESGLAALGVATPKMFWEEIVGPTWVAGSTTAIGYKRVLTERIGALTLATGATDAGSAAAASRFVDFYLDHSRIDSHWRPILENLSAHPGVALVIATDHYAEATEIIINNINSWNIPARKTGEKGGTTPDSSVKNREVSPFFVANSADIGFWKADRRFWEVLKSRLPLEMVRSALIIDDFGFNEEQGDRYGERSRVADRQEKTLAVLEELFHAAQAIPFLLKGGERGGAPALRIVETGKRISEFLRDIERKP